MELNGAHFEALRDALIEAFDLPSLRQMVRISLDEKLDAIAGGANLQEVTFNLIEWAERTGRVNDLLAAALQENPSSPALLPFKAHYLLNTGAPSQNSVATQQPTIGGDVYQIGQVCGGTIAIGRNARTDSSAGDKAGPATS